MAYSLTFGVALMVLLTSKAAANALGVVPVTELLAGRSKPLVKPFEIVFPLNILATLYFPPV